MPIDKKFKEYIEQNNPRVLLDTNILSRGCSGSSNEKKLVGEICTICDICICDTVYWEFLRNNSIDTFRERRDFLGKMKSSGFLEEKRIIHEDEKITEMHSRLFALLIRLYSKEPKRVLRFLSPDLWISAVCIENKIDHILTENNSDFPSDFFETISKLIPEKGHVIYCLKFKREVIRKYWIEFSENPAVEISCKSFFPKRID